MKQLPMLSTDDKLAEIKRLYFQTTRQTIEQDFAKAIDLLKSMTTEEERERATVFMDGLAEMRRDWRGRRVAPKESRRERDFHIDVARGFSRAAYASGSCTLG